MRWPFRLLRVSDAPLPNHRRGRAMRSPHALMLLSLAGLASLAAFASWYDRGTALRAAENQVELTVGLMQQHALNVFETEQLVYQQIQLRTMGLDWGAINRSDELASFLRNTRDRMSRISSIWLADAAGHVRASSGLPFPSGLSFENREDFRAHRESDHGMVVGDQHLGSFGLSWRRSSSTGEFDGVIGIDIEVEYFAKFFRGLDAKNPHRAVLVRADGTVLSADSDAGEPKRFPPNSELMRSIAGGVQNENWNVMPTGGRHFFRWRQLDPYPVYVAYALDEDIVLRPWHGHLLIYAIVAGAVWAALCLIIHLASDRAVAEEALQQARKMEAIGQLASGVAHDFNNLLTAVIGNLDRIARDPQAPRSVLRLTAAATRAATRGASLTARLLAFARQQPSHAQAVRIDGLLDAMLPLIRDALGESISLSCSFDPDLSGVRIDPGQFEAALLNLALNARDAMPRGGKLRIEARNAVVGATDAKRRAIPPGDYVVIEIGDTGVGMRADVAGRAFEPFFTTKEAGKGSGLGLSMVYGFARQSGGTAEIESRLGTGATIRLYFPCAEMPVLRAPPACSADPIPRKTSILVVEDQDDIRELLAASLQEYGHTVRTIDAAAEAVEILAHDAAIQILVTDIILPGGMTGLDLARKAQALLPDLKIVLISGNALEETVKTWQLARCAFLQKPFRPSDLNRVVGELLMDDSRERDGLRSGTAGALLAQRSVGE